MQATTPVIVGVGEVVQRPDAGIDLDPLSLAAEAGRRAADDAGARDVLAAVDSIDVVNIVSWSYADPGAAAADMLGATPRRAVHSGVGGHQPVALLDAAAARIAAGESDVGLVVGGEAMRTLETAMRAGTMPPWPPPPPGAAPLDPRAHAAGAMAALDLCLPSDVYPLYEQASRAAAGLSPRAAIDDAARRWAASSAIAACNPTAWLREPRTAAEIAAVTPENRLVAWPYPKLMNALLGVDQAAAVIVTSAERARTLGIAEDTWVFPLGGAGAAEPDDVLARAGFERTVAGGVALDRALQQHGLDTDAFDLVELYSCFPCVPRMAAAHLGLGGDAPTTVTGGLTFFGGPANDYMLHAVAAMVRQLRAGAGTLGLLYGQGGYATKHHALPLAVRPPERYIVDDRVEAQRLIDAVPRPPFDPTYRGPGTVETFTIPYDRAGAPKRVVVVGRAPDGRRFAGEASPGPEVAAALTSLDDEPIDRPIVAAGAHAPTGTTRIELG